MFGPLTLSFLYPLLCGRLFDDHMGIRPTKTKGTDSGDLPATRPRCRFARHLDRQPLPRDMWIWFLEMQMLGDHPMLHRQNHLDQPGNPGGGFQMADVSLDRTY